MTVEQIKQGYGKTMAIQTELSAKAVTLLLNGEQLFLQRVTPLSQAAISSFVLAEKSQRNQAYLQLTARVIMQLTVSL